MRERLSGRTPTVRGVSMGSRRRSAIHVRRDKAALFQWVQGPPGDRSSRKQPEQTRRLARSAPTDYSVFNAADKRPLAVVDVASAHRSVAGILELDIISARKTTPKWRIAQAGGINGRYHARSNHADRVRLHGGKAPVRRQRYRAVRGADRRSGDA